MSGQLPGEPLARPLGRRVTQRCLQTGVLPDKPRRLRPRRQPVQALDEAGAEKRAGGVVARGLPLGERRSAARSRTSLASSGVSSTLPTLNASPSRGTIAVKAAT